MKYFVSTVQADVQDVVDVLNANFTPDPSDLLYEAKVAVSDLGDGRFLVEVDADDELLLTAGQQAALLTAEEL